MADVVYNSEEREEILRKMDAVTHVFYRMAVQTNCHPFIEFCGLMREYLKCCEAAHAQGIDFTQANAHTGEALPMAPHNLAYLGEKLGCIYGPALRDPKNLRALMSAMESG